MTSTDTPANRPRRAARPNRSLRLRAGATVLAAVTLLVAGCGLRWEEPGPAPLVAGPVEQARQHATADAVALRVLTGRLAAEVTDPATLEALAEIESATDQHLTALGGLYDPGTEDTAGSQSPGSAEPSDPAEPSTTAAEPSAPTESSTTGEQTETTTAPAEGPPAVTPPDLVALLEEAAAAARQDAGEVPDGPLARLLASVATARLLLAEELTAVLTAADAAATPPSATEPATETATGPAVTPTPPDAVPEGLTERDVQALVQSEDALGLAWEVTAARSADAARARAALRAEQHRERAEQWARAGGISGTDRDPRRSAYDLPDPVTASDADPAARTTALATLESDLATTYAALVATAAEGSRSALVDALIDASRTAAALTGVVPVFPGLPELTA